MNFRYNDLLRERLYALQETLGLTEYDFVVDSEQAFIKMKTFKPKTIYVMTKLLQNDREISIDIQPVQIMILAEQNSLETSKLLFSEFAKKYNFNVFKDGDTWVKQQYSDPVVLSNFNTVNWGYRSVLYIGATLYIMEDVVDVENVTIDGIQMEVTGFNISYSASMNTQQFFQHPIAKSEKSISSMSIAMSVPVVKSNLINKITNILNGTYNGNETFLVLFYFNGVEFELEMKLTSMQFTTAPNQPPAMNLGFIL